MTKGIHGDIAFYIEAFGIVTIDKHTQLLSAELNAIFKILAGDDRLWVISFLS